MRRRRMLGGRRFLSVILLLAAAVPAAACVDQLPDQDLRITTAVPAAKLSADLLWKDFQDDPAAARDRYWGKAVEITGVVTRASDAAAQSGYVFFALADEHGIHAALLDEAAPEVLTSIAPGGRLTLRCFYDATGRGVQRWTRRPWRRLAVSLGQPQDLRSRDRSRPETLRAA